MNKTKQKPSHQNDVRSSEGQKVVGQRIQKERIKGAWNWGRSIRAASKALSKRNVRFEL